MSEDDKNFPVYDDSFFASEDIAQSAKELDPPHQRGIMVLVSKCKQRL